MHDKKLDTIASHLGTIATTLVALLLVVAVVFLWPMLKNPAPTPPAEPESIPVPFDLKAMEAERKRLNEEARQRGGIR